jgi:hypothetical protein
MKRKKKTGTPRRGRKNGRVSHKRRRTVSTENSGKTVEAKKRGRPENLKPWKRGQSGNPGGRPRKLRLTDAARDWLEQVDEKTGLTNAMLCASALGKKARKGSPEAFKAIGDRAEGKPAQSIEVVTEHGLGPVLSELNRGELRRYCETGELPERFRTQESKADG